MALNIHKFTVTGEHQPIEITFEYYDKIKQYNGFKVGLRNGSRRMLNAIWKGDKPKGVIRIDGPHKQIKIIFDYQDEKFNITKRERLTLAAASKIVEEAERMIVK